MSLAAGSDTLATDLKALSITSSALPDKTHSQPDPIYSTVQLHDPQSQIRLVKLLTGSPDDPIRIELFVVDSLNSEPYEALSYAWGSRDTDVRISVNGRPFSIAANLVQALNSLRLVDDTRVMWIDALCINQADDTEKSFQVSLMGQIYRNAEEVVVFLGEEKEDSAMVMQYLNLPDVDHDESQSLSQEAGNEEVKMGQTVAERRSIQWRIQHCGFDEPRFLRAADAFFKRPWFSRVWVVQEWYLAKRDPRFYCGRVWTTSMNLHNKWKVLHAHLLAEATPYSGNPEVVADTQIDIEQEWIKKYELRWNISNLLAMKRGGKKEGKSFLPTTFMIGNLRRHTTDPRDRVFATRDMLDPISRQVFVPNYTVGVNDIFTKLASYLLVHIDQGHVYDLYELTRSGGVPSWMPDFNKPISAHGVTALCQYWKSTVAGVERGASWIRDVGHLSIYNGVLGVTGVEIDTLDVTKCFGDAPEIEITGNFWRLEGLLQETRPLDTLPDGARALFPRCCLIPFPSFKEDHTNRAEKKESDLTRQQFPTTATIPGYAHVAAEATMVLIELSNSVLKHLRCDTLTPPARLYPYTLAAKLVTATFDWTRSEGFIGGAYFDLPNLKSQIMSVELPKHSNDDSTASQSSSEVDSPHEKEAEGPCSCRDYSPKYTYIKDILREAKEQQVLDRLKKMACNLADSYHRLVAQHVAKKGPPSMQVKASVEEKAKSTFATNESYLREISENCSCPGDKQEWHRKVLSYLMKASKEEWEELLPKVLSFSPEKGDGLSGLYLNFKRQYTGMFITRLGFCGFTFQRDVAFKKGDKLVVLDGIPAPMILEDTGDGTTYRMKAAAEVFGLRVVDVAKVVELGVFKRKDYKIV